MFSRNDVRLVEGLQKLVSKIFEKKILMFVSKTKMAEHVDNLSATGWEGKKKKGKQKERNFDEK